MGLGCVHLRGRSARGEDLQDTKLEVLPVPGVGGGQLPEGDVNAVAISGLLAPAAQETLRAVGLAHIQPAGAGVGNEVDTLHGAEGRPPLAVSVVGDDGLELFKAHKQRIEILGTARGTDRISLPPSWRSPGRLSWPSSPRPWSTRSPGGPPGQQTQRRCQWEIVSKNSAASCVLRSTHIRAKTSRTWVRAPSRSHIPLTQS